MSKERGGRQVVVVEKNSITFVPGIWDRRVSLSTIIFLSVCMCVHACVRAYI